MLRKVTIFLFNLLPAYFQTIVLSIDQRFLNRFSLSNTLDQFKEFTFIQVGANDGVSFDSFFEYLKFRNGHHTGIVIEPIPEYFLELKNNYKDDDNVVCLNYALHPSLSEIEIFRVESKHMAAVPNWAKGIASFDNNHHVKLGIPSKFISTEKVNCLTFETMLQYFPKIQRHFNYLQIDVEGFDAEIIKMIDFESVKFDIIKFERINLETEQYFYALEILTANNYTIFETVEDSIAISKKIKIIIN